VRRLLLVFGFLWSTFAGLPSQAQVVCVGGGCSSGGAAGAVTPGTTTVTGCTNLLLFGDASAFINCNAAFVANSSGAGNGVITIAKSPSGASQTSNFLNVTGTITPAGASTWPVYFRVTGAGSVANELGALNSELLAGYTGASSNYAIRGANFSAGTGTAVSSMDNIAGSNGAVLGRTVGTTTGSNVGGTFQASGGLENAGLVADATTAKNAGWNVGAIIRGRNTGSTPAYNGAYIGLDSGGADPTGINSGLQVNNSDQAAPIFIGQDNGAVLPTTAATATITITDGAHLQLGNGVLTNATMTPEVQGRVCGGGLCHSYTWSNAQVAALAGTAGDITVTTLPAKTQITNAYVVITGTAAGPTTVTVSCGDAIAGTPFINYVVASDAKVAANTVYGDVVAERGTSIDVEFYYLPSYTATTLITCHFISTGANLSTVTGSTGRVILQTALLP
jgi:hypothetical protein